MHALHRSLVSSSLRTLRPDQSRSMTACPLLACTVSNTPHDDAHSQGGMLYEHAGMPAGQCLEALSSAPHATGRHAWQTLHHGCACSIQHNGSSKQATNSLNAHRRISFGGSCTHLSIGSGWGSRAVGKGFCPKRKAEAGRAAGPAAAWRLMPLTSAARPTSSSTSDKPSARKGEGNQWLSGRPSRPYTSDAAQYALLCLLSAIMHGPETSLSQLLCVHMCFCRSSKGAC